MIGLASVYHWSQAKPAVIRRAKSFGKTIAVEPKLSVCWGWWYILRDDRWMLACQIPHKPLPNLVLHIELYSVKSIHISLFLSFLFFFSHLYFSKILSLSSISFIMILFSFVSFICAHGFNYHGTWIITKSKSTILNFSILKIKQKLLLFNIFWFFYL